MRVLAVLGCLLMISANTFSQIDLIKLIDEGKKVKNQIGTGSEVVIDDLENKVIGFLLENGKAIISLAEAEMLKTIKIPGTIMTIVDEKALDLPNELEYEVMKGDKLVFNLKPGRFSKIKRIELQLNEQFPLGIKNAKERIEYVAESEGKLKMRINGRKLYQGKLSIQVQKESAPKNVIAELQRDTVIVMEKVPGMLRDTVYQDIVNQSYVISPRLDITSSPFLQIPVEILTRDNLYGLIFWIGLNNQDQLIDGDNLIRYFRGEVRFLPNSLNQDIEWAWSNAENLQRFKSGKGFHQMPLNFEQGSKSNTWGVVLGKSENPIYLVFKNNSSLYEYPIYIMIKAIFIESYEGEVEKEKMEISEYIQLTLK